MPPSAGLKLHGLGAFVRLAALVVVCALLPRPAALASDWMRIDTPNFIVVGDAGEKTLRLIATRFEGFREGLRRVLTTEARATPVPTVVVVFRSDSAFRPFKPRYRGDVVAVSGWYSPGKEVDFVSVTTAGNGWARLILHEYAHAVLDNVLPGLPLWLSEGLAEYYSTFELRRDGREAVVGGAIDSHLQRLRRSMHLPLERLFEVDQASPLYNEGARQRSVFYAQSWALVHMLIHGGENEGARLWRFARAVSDGMPAAEAWEVVFGAENVEGRLNSYVRTYRLSSKVHEFSETVGDFEIEATELGDAAAEAWLGDLLFRQDRLEEAALRLENAAALDSTGGKAEATLALLRLRGGRPDEARQLLDEAFASTASDWITRYYAAAGAVELWLPASIPGLAREALEEPRVILRRIVSERPDLPHALSLLGTASLVAGDDPAEAERMLERAWELAPGRDDYATMFAQVLAQQGDYVRATEILSPVLGRARSDAARETVRRLLDQFATAEREAAARNRGSR